MDQSQRLVLSEIEERVERIFAVVEELRVSRGNAKSRRELVDSVFRAVHSVKGSASASGLDTLAKIAHEFESLLQSLRLGRARLDEEVLQTLETAAQALLDTCGAGDFENQRSHDALFARLQQLSTTDRKSADSETILQSMPSDIWQSLGQSEKHSLEESIQEGAHLYLIATNFDISDFDQQFQRLKDKLLETGEVISTSPSVDSEHPQKINFRILFARDANLEQVRATLEEIPDLSVSEVLASRPPTLKTSTDEGFPVDNNRSFNNASEVEGSNLIRITLEDLDHLISSAHKLFHKTSTCLDLALENLSDNPIDKELQSDAAEICNSFIELAAEIINLRMVPIERILQRALRSGRAAAGAAGKEIDFVVTGRDVLIDKALGDAIADPLIQLVRNAVDHGIESATERSLTAKSERGSILIEASTRLGQISVRVVDDGRGIDPVVISKAAIRLAVTTEGSLLDMQQSLRLIFRPGFSTATSVSGISGRGVGLDVVETAVEQVGGEVVVDSSPGVGSTFGIRLPVTFGLQQVVHISCANQPYLLDKTLIVSCRDFDDREIEATESGKVLRVDDELLPLVDLHQLLGRPPANSERGRGLLVCQIAREASDGTNSFERIGLLVDAIKETQQVLVRNLGSRGARWFGVAGAAELRDGRVALLLDLPRLLTL